MNAVAALADDIDLPRIAPGTRVVVALSGGVDSSLTALLLARAGLEVRALFMKNWNEPLPDGGCRWEREVEDALTVCDRIGIPLDTVDLSREYHDAVFAEFLREIDRGRTPNPDVLCNREVKFRAFLAHARGLGARFVATGHYARIGSRDGALTLLRGRDPNKDQSYFLHALGQEALGAALFPIGALEKTRVRALAREAGLSTHAKKDSTGICFIGERRYREFLARWRPALRGEIRALDGRLLGEHPGVAFYTLGQRNGLGIGGVRGAPDAPWYVVAKDPATNTLHVAQGHDHPALMSTRLTTEAPTWIRGTAPPAPLRCTAQTRYRQRDEACTVIRIGPDACEVRFDRPQRAVTPGQSAVFYAGQECLGGAVIAATG